MTNLRVAQNVLTSSFPVTLIDLTDTPRVGFRGAQSGEYLTGRGFELPEVPNRAVVQKDGSIVARLSQTEYLVLGSASDDGQRIADEEASWELDDRANYMLPRQDSHGWIQLKGTKIDQVMAKLCGVDLRASTFKVGYVAQTSAARINVIVISSAHEEVPCFDLLFDRASLEYFSDAIVDAMVEFMA